MFQPITCDSLRGCHSQVLNLRYHSAVLIFNLDGLLIHPFHSFCCQALTAESNFQPSEIKFGNFHAISTPFAIRMSHQLTMQAKNMWATTTMITQNHCFLSRAEKKMIPQVTCSRMIHRDRHAGESAEIILRM